MQTFTILTALVFSAQVLAQHDSSGGSKEAPQNKGFIIEKSVVEMGNKVVIKVKAPKEFLQCKDAQPGNFEVRFSVPGRPNSSFYSYGKSLEDGWINVELPTNDQMEQGKYQLQSFNFTQANCANYKKEFEKDFTQVSYDRAFDLVLPKSNINVITKKVRAGDKVVVEIDPANRNVRLDEAQKGNADIRFAIPGAPAGKDFYGYAKGLNGKKIRFELEVPKDFQPGFYRLTQLGQLRTFANTELMNFDLEKLDLGFDVVQ